MAKKKAAKKAVKKKERTFTETKVKEMLNELWYGIDEVLRDAVAEIAETARLHDVDWDIPRDDGKTYSDEDDEDE